MTYRAVSTLTVDELTRMVCIDNPLRMLGNAAAAQVRQRSRALGPLLRFTAEKGFERL